MAKAYRTVADAGHAYLYHYQKFNPQHLTKLLRDQQIYCSNPANLNDPWDCKPWYDTHAIQDPHDIEQLIVWTRQVAEPPLPPDKQAQLEVKLRTQPDFRAEFINQFSRGNHETIRQQRIYCLTPDPLSTLMWSHYTDNHRGICLEFHAVNPLFSEALEVIYCSAYPRWVPHDLEQIAFEMFLTKSDDWKYEREFRIISTSNGDQYPLNLTGDCLRLPLGALKSVIVGCEGDYDAIGQIIKKYAPELPIRRIVRAQTQYRLVIADL